MADPRDPYKVLQVDPEADPDVIQAAYRRLAQKYHPDRAMADGRQDPGGATRMAAINAAWAILRDPERRAALDRERAHAAGHRGSLDAVPERWRADRAAHQAPVGRSATRAFADGRGATGSAGPGTTAPQPAADSSAESPPGRPSGSVLGFGRYSGWSLGEIARVEPEYLEWLDRMPIGRPHRAELDELLRRLGRRRSTDPDPSERRGLFRRR